MPSILRKMRIIAAELGESELEKWVSCELNGYYDNEQLPEYRRADAVNIGFFVGFGGAQIKNYRFPTINLPEDVRRLVDRVEFTESVATIKGLMEGEAKVGIAWPPNVVALCQRRVIENYALTQAHMAIPKPFLLHIMESVRNRLLEFILELEKRHPDIANQESLRGLVPVADIKQVLHNTIIGNNNVVAANSTVRDNTVGVQMTSMDDLFEILKGKGVKPDEIVNLKEAIESDINGGCRTACGDGVKNWLGDLLTSTVDSVRGRIPSMVAPLLAERWPEIVGFFM